MPSAAIPGRTLRLGVDATLVARGKGLARIQSDFLAALAEPGLAGDVTVFVADDADITRLPQPPAWRYLAVRARPMLVWEQLGLPRAARRERLDVVFTTSERAALWGPPRVVYIFEHPRHRAERNRLVGASLRQRLVDRLTVALFPLSMRLAAAVLVASQATARDVARLRPSVVYPGFSAGFSPGTQSADGGYFLHIASDDPRENSETVVAALGALARRGDRPRLLVAGPVIATRASLERLAAELGVAEQVVWPGFVPGDELVDLYRGAIAYVDPSLYEGFGLQALESLACGVPAIASNRTSLPEVVGDAGYLLDPYDVDGFADAMRELLNDEGLREHLRARALAQAAKFTWERTVREILDHCERVASGA